MIKLFKGDTIEFLFGNKKCTGVIISENGDWHHPHTVIVKTGGFNNVDDISVMPANGKRFRIGCYNYGIHGNDTKLKLKSKGWKHRQYTYFSNKSLWQRIKYVFTGRF